MNTPAATSHAPGATVVTSGSLRVLVFRTSVRDVAEVDLLRRRLDRTADRWNFDLDDRDRILRIETRTVDAAGVITLLNSMGFDCIELE
jgi:hypothetical protein